MANKNEISHSINGVTGRVWTIKNQGVRAPGCFAAQKWVSESRPIEGYGTNGKINVEIRFDDECKNGHNTFAITASVYTAESRRAVEAAAGGCLHADIAKIFPELAHLIQWHLGSTDGPTHYLQNAAYLAGDRDYNGRRVGEPSAWENGYRFGNSPITQILKPKFFKWIESRRAENAGEFRVVAIAHVNRPGCKYDFAPKYTFVGFGETWYDCPFDYETSAQEFAHALNKCEVFPVRIVTQYSEGKKRELQRARNVAVWPDATDVELSAEPEKLRGALQSRLPALIARMRADIESAGFVWQSAE